MTKRKPLSAETRERLSLLRKGVKRTEAEKLKIRLGQQNSAKNRMRLQKLRLARELKQQAKDEKRREIESRRLHKIALRIYFDSLKVGPSFIHTREGLRKISEANKRRTPWNKGIKPWNHNKKWPTEVKDNISRGMVVYWIQRKEERRNNSKEITSRRLIHNTTVPSSEFGTVILQNNLP